MIDERKKVLEFTSPDSDTIIYACGWCRLTLPGNNRSGAEACCRCSNPQCGGERVRGRTECAECHAEGERIRRETRHAKLLALPVVEDYDGPVYVESSSGLGATNHFFDDSDAAAEALYDDGLTVADFAEAIIHPCIVTLVPVPDIQDWVEETWASEYEEYDYELSKAATDAIAACTATLEVERPTVWYPKTDERIVLLHPCPDEEEDEE